MRFKKKNLSPRETYLAVVTMLVLVIVGVAVAVQRTLDTYHLLNTKIGSQEKKLIALRNILEGQKKLNEEYARNVAGQSEIEDSGLLLKEIEAIARRTGINIVNMKPAAPRDEGGYKSYGIMIETQDDVQHFSSFLFTITEELNRVGVERLNILSQARNEPPLISLSLSAIGLKNDR
jgi:hypothetical protein